MSTIPGRSVVVEEEMPGWYLVQIFVYRSYLGEIWVMCMVKYLQEPARLEIFVGVCDWRVY